MLNAATELQHLSKKLQDVFQSVIHNPGQYYEEAQNAENELKFQIIKLEDCDRLIEISQVNTFQKLS
jgi:hypothetical protein